MILTNGKLPKLADKPLKVQHYFVGLALWVPISDVFSISIWQKQTLKTKYRLFDSFSVEMASLQTIFIK